MCLGALYCPPIPPGALPCCNAPTQEPTEFTGLESYVAECIAAKVILHPHVKCPM